jgi:uncharacterized membrane protein YraQ (UPF0718 family)
MTNYIPIALALVALLLGAITWSQGGPGMVLAGLLSGGQILLEVIPLLLAAFLIAGLIQTLVTRDFVTRWLGSESGWKGILLACLGGALIPGGPYVYYPITAALLSTGASLGVMVAFVTAKNLWSLSRLPLEVALLGPRLTLIRFLVTLVLPPVLGYLAEILFGSYVDVIREKMPI